MADDSELAALLVLLGSEVAAPLTQALERIQEQLAAPNATPSEPLLALRAPLRRARDATVLAAQVGRLRSGRVVPSPQRCALHTVLHQVVEMHRREAQSRGLQLRLDAYEADVIADPSLLPSLLHALLDWALAHTRSSIELQSTLGAWPPSARLQCRFALHKLDQSHAPPPPTLDGLRWMLVRHTAQAMGIQVRRADEAGICVTLMDLPLWRHEQLISLGSEPPEPRLGQDTQPFAGWRAMVVSADTAFQRQVAELLRPQGWTLEPLPSIDAGFQQCLEALPHAIVVDGALAGPDLQQWRSHVQADVPGYCFIEVGTAPPPPTHATAQGQPMYCRAQHLRTELPALLQAALTPRESHPTLRP